MVRPLVTASRSCSRPLANDEMPGSSASQAAAIHCGRSWPASSVIMAAKPRTRSDVAWSSGQRSRTALSFGFSSSASASGRRVSQFVTSRTVGGAAERLPGRAREVVADDGVAAVVAEGLDLEEQAPDAAGAPSRAGRGRLERVELAGRVPSTVRRRVPARSRRGRAAGPNAGPSPGGGRSPAARALRRAARGPVRGVGGCARRTSPWDRAARRPPVPAGPWPALPPGQVAVRPGRRGGRRRTSRRLWPGSATGGSGRRPGPRPVPRFWLRRRTSRRGPGR